MKYFLLISLFLMQFSCKSEKEKITEGAKLFVESEYGSEKDFKKLDSLKMVNFDTITLKNQALQYYSEKIQKLTFYNEIAGLNLDKYKSESGTLDLYRMLESQTLVDVQKSEVDKAFNEYKKYFDSAGEMLKVVDKFESRLKKFDSIKHFTTNIDLNPISDAKIILLGRTLL